MAPISQLVSESSAMLFQSGTKRKCTILYCRKISSGPSAPLTGSHFRGIWERCIRTIRKILWSLLGEQITDESLPTLMCEVESILNSRPISTVSSDPCNLEPLTPNHLLLLTSEVPLPPGLFQHKELLSRCRWRQVEYLADVFWRRWC